MITRINNKTIATECRWCGAWITFLKTEKGRFIPLEPTPEARERAERSQLYEHGAPGLTPHFALCRQTERKVNAEPRSGDRPRRDA